MLMSYKKRKIVQVGVYQQQGHIQFVWLDNLKQVQFLSFLISEANIKTQLMARVVQNFPQNRLQLRLIGCVSPHLTWSKTLILPHMLNTQECEQQCSFVLQKELPIPLDELWFDYASTDLKQGFRLDIHAIRQQTACEVQRICDELLLNVLDVAHHAIMRTFCFLLGKEVQENALYLYQDESHCFAIMNVSHSQQLLQTSENLTALYAQFCQRFDVEIERIYVYQTVDTEQTDLPENWRRVMTNLPFIALGNALWQRDLYQNNAGFSTVILNENLNERH
ncbi:pilus assembly protein PilM [Rodentibacter pneumotropicus]|uniref:Competence protein ComA n=1 Tax=Rodentibacter pneumotropicus TaxID=758 RepID=A0A4S2QCS1_9PAST|nr:pilus assembly protein PilM [Rodentibacter pneumotropicus]TGZ99078.1 competence protein ComA [Rodentibacter pneumotropicus]THA00599.1 competence protein ComA [Rodentibacter pneumotropicus]THA06674.1 competence protein ComA [Rodentibacter pneumotropicus]THA14085.1 competence protein ComA [Rodentibacter pneumotropicus]